MAIRLLSLRPMKTIRSAYSEGGLKTVILRSLKKMLLPVVRMGGLVFVECDLRKLLPEKEELPGVVAREAVVGDGKLFKNQEVFLERINAGHRCFVGIDSATGKLANYRWVATSGAYIPEIDRFIILKPGETYTFDLETLPEFRRRGIDSYMRRYIYQRLKEQGFTRVYSYVRADNFPMFRSSRRLLRPIGRVWYVQVRGFKCLVFGERRFRLPELVTSYSRGVQAAESG